MAYVGFPPKRSTHAIGQRRWSADGFMGRIALAASMLFVGMIVFGL
jgi:hypothetical protein